MGIYDRDYYRNEGPGLFSSFGGRAVVCKWLILINIVVYIIQLSTLERDRFTGEMQLGAFTDALDLRPDKVLEEGQVWRLLTHAFLHGLSIWHIVFNMLFLWWMGNELEEMYGSREFLTLYLSAALFAGVCLTLHSLTMPRNVAGLGASGAVSALTVLFACHWPNRTILLFFILPIPIWLMVVLVFGYDFLVFLLQFTKGFETTTAVAAHLGGALFGYLYYKRQWRLTGMWEQFKTWRRQRSRPKLRIYREEPNKPATVPAHAPAEYEIDEHLEAKVDAVLEKMSLVGKDNLTESEKEILLKASEIYRRRRT